MLQQASLKPSPTAHRAMIAGLAAGIDGALLLVFKKLHQFGNGCFVDTEALLAGMGNGLRTSTPAGLPGRGPRVADLSLHLGEKADGTCSTLAPARAIESRA